MLYEVAPGPCVIAQLRKLTSVKEPQPGEWSGAVLIDLPVLGFVKAYVRRADITPGFADAGNG